MVHHEPARGLISDGSRRLDLSKLSRGCFTGPLDCFVGGEGERNATRRLGGLVSRYCEGCGGAVMEGYWEFGTVGGRVVPDVRRNLNGAEARVDTDM